MKWYPYSKRVPIEYEYEYRRWLSTSRIEFLNNRSRPKAVNGYEISNAIPSQKYYPVRLETNRRLKSVPCTLSLVVRATTSGATTFQAPANSTADNSD